MEEEEKNSIEKFKKLDKNVSPVTRITAVKIGAQRNIAFQIFIAQKQIHKGNWGFPHEFMDFIGWINTTRSTLKH